MNKITTLIAMIALCFDAMAINYTITNEKLTENKTVRVLTVTYETLGLNGQQNAICSGLITMPEYEKPFAMLLDNHYTITDNSSAPSVSLEPNDFSQYVTDKFLVVAPDYLGFGASKNTAHPYMCNNICARNSIDLALVAREIIKDRNIELQEDSMYVVGYSQGGSVAFDVHRQLSLDPELADQLHHARTYCGDGAYDLKMLMNWYLFDNSKNVSLPFVMILVANGFLHGTPDFFSPNRKLSDFLSKKLKSYEVDGYINSKTHGQIETNLYFTLRTGNSKNVKDYVSEEMLDSTSSMYKEFMQAASFHTHLTDWKPYRPITFYHCVQDDVLSVQNAYNAINALGLDVLDQMIVDDPSGLHMTMMSDYYRYVRNNIINTVKRHLAGIEEIRLDESPSARAFDLTGRRVTPSVNSKGIYIINGKKHINR